MMSTRRQAAWPRSHAPSPWPAGRLVTEADGAAAPAAAATGRASPTSGYCGYGCRLVLGFVAVMLLPPDVVVPRAPVAAAYRPSPRMAPSTGRGRSSPPPLPLFDRRPDLGAGSTRASPAPRAARGEDAAGDDGRNDDDTSRRGRRQPQRPSFPPPLPLRPPTPGRSMLFDPDRGSDRDGDPNDVGVDSPWTLWEEEDDDEIASLAMYWEQTKGAYNAVFVRFPVVLAGAFYAKNYLAEGRPLVMDLGFWGGPFEIHPMVVVTFLWVMLL